MARTAQWSPSDVEAVILTRNDPTRLNACLWSIVNQTVRPGSILLVNTGGWMAEAVGGTLDIASELLEVRLHRLRNGPLGAVHAAALRSVRRPVTWFFQDDAVVSPRCLESMHGLSLPLLPRIQYPDYEAMPGEGREQPQTTASAKEPMLSIRLPPAHRGPCLGLLMPTALAHKIAAAVEHLPMGLDDALVQLAGPCVVDRDAIVYHSRPERPRWNRIVDLMKQEVLPRVKVP